MAASDTCSTTAMATDVADSAWPSGWNHDPAPCMTANGSASRLLRFGLVGIASNIAGYLVYLLLTGIGGTPKLTMTVLYGVGATIGFIGNREFTFAHQGSVFKA